MAYELNLTPLEADLDHIQKLDDEPNDVGGLSAQQLKAEFDKAGNDIKDFINNTHLPEIKRQVEQIVDEKIYEIGSGDMAKLVYDPTHRERDVFEYVDSRDTGTISASRAIAKTLNLSDPVIDDLIKRLLPWKAAARFDKAGTYTFTVPEGVTSIGAFILGGGGSGYAATSATQISSGGGSGELIQTEIEVIPGEDIPVVVGAGGASTSSGSSSGGSSSCAGVTARPGQGGNYFVDGNWTSAGVRGGQASDGPYSSGVMPLGCCMSEYMTSTETRMVRYLNYSVNPYNMFDPTDLHIYCGAGGSSNQTTTVERERGHAGAGASGSGAIIAQSATAPGDGGGGAASSTGSTKSGAGADGLVIIYIRGDLL